MRAEAILSEADLVALVAELIPVKILLGNEGNFSIDEATSVSLVADLGLRIVCKAKVHWPVLGVSVPITLHSLTGILVPSIVRRPSGDVLVFKLQIEQADLAGVPAMIDAKITDKLNHELASEKAELAWDFTKTLSHAFSLPRRLEPLDAFELHVAAGEVKITAEALVLSVAFRAKITRRVPIVEPESAA